ncbi:MAG: hypothetical protein ACR2IA_06300 [Pyrinomonadaceae bacterium]
MTFLNRKTLLIFILLAGLAACSRSPAPATPFETLQTYVRAIKKKDTTTMKLLLSDATIKMHQQAAKEQGITLDEIVQRETLFTADQKSVDFKNEVMDGDKATIEMKNSAGIWDKVAFVREDGIWKIDKPAFANSILEQNEKDNQRIDQLINQGKEQP